MRNKVQCEECSEDSCLIKYLIGSEYLKAVRNGMTQNVYKKDTHIFKEGDPIFGIYFIQSGGVKVVTTSLNGREQVVRLAKAGQILGHRGLDSARYYFNAIALMDTMVCFIESKVFNATCLNSAELSYHLMILFAHELRRAELRVKYQAQMNIREKVAEAFLYINEVFGVNPETKLLNISLSRQDIADTAGTTAEQVTRQLRDFENEKLIARDKWSIKILDIKGMEKIVEDYAIF